MPKHKQLKLTQLRPERTSINVAEESKNNPISDPDKLTRSHSFDSSEKIQKPTSAMNLKENSCEHNKTPGGGFKRNSDTQLLGYD